MTESESMNQFFLFFLDVLYGYYFSENKSKIALVKITIGKKDSPRTLSTSLMSIKSLFINLVEKV